MHKQTKSNPQPVTRATLHPSRWIGLVGTLLLALVMGALYQPASALEPPTDVAIFLYVVGKPQTICLSDIGTVRVVLAFRGTFKTGPVALNLVGLFINAAIDNPGVLQLTEGYGAQQRTGYDLETPIGVSFDVRGLQEGAATLTFSTDPVRALGQQYSVAPVTSTVKVVNCRYQVDILSRWYVPLAPGNTIELQAVVNRATLTRQEDGTYSGTGTVVWLYNIVTPCEHQDTIPNSTVTLEGNITENGTLRVKAKFITANLSETAVCHAASGDFSTSSKNFLRPDELEIINATEGGVQWWPHFLLYPGGKISGYSTIVVAPAK